MASLLRSHFVAAAVVGVAVLMALGNGGGGIATCGASEAVHLVVGGDQGWDAADLDAWSVGRIFRVGDSVWFAHSAAEDNILELGSKEEFDACHLANPIRMYTGGIHRVTLDDEGTRYFASSQLSSCRSGLKLHLKVLPPGTDRAAEVVVAAGPKPSGSGRIHASLLPMLIVVILISCLSF